MEYSREKIPQSEIKPEAASSKERSHAAGISPQRMSGRLSDILLNATVLILPMLLLSCILLGLVFHYRVRHNGLTNSEFSLAGETDESGIYYVSLSVTYLTTIASWCSSLAPMLGASVVALASFPVAHRMLRAARSNEARQLPTPYQLALTIGMANGGGYSSLGHWLKYLGGWKKQRQPQGPTLKHVAFALVTATVLGFIVFLTDTWLHFTTRPVAFTQLQPLDTMPDYSFGLTNNCLITNNTFRSQFALPNGAANTSPCGVNIAAVNNYLVNGSQVLAVLNNVSNIMTVGTFAADIPYAYHAVPASPEIAGTDYTATTYSVRTQCRPVSAQCNLNAYIGASTPYYCNSAFNGDVTQSSWYMTYFTDATLSNNNTLYGIHNPYYFGWAANINAQGGGTLINTQGFPVDANIIAPQHGGTAFVLACNATVYDTTYDSVNGTVTKFVAQPSNDSVANAVQVPMANTGVAQYFLESAASLATFSSSSQELADKMAVAYSKAALSLFAQSVRPLPAVHAQARYLSLVARVPAAPLFALVVANLLFVVAGIVLVILSLSVPGEEVKDVQARLSIAGLVADQFESRHGRGSVRKMEELFEENEGHGSSRVGIDRSDEGGYAYKVWSHLDHE